MDPLTKTKVAGIPAGFHELTFQINDITLNYVEGPNNGLPLLLIPGQMESWQGYKCVLPELSNRYHIFVTDLRGHGKSTRTPGHYSYNICGEDLKCFIEQVIQEPALVAGLSSGGVLSIWLAANLPDQVLAIIAEDPPIFSSIWPRIQNEKFMYRNFEVAYYTFRGDQPRDIELYFSNMGAPIQGKTELVMIPGVIVKLIGLIYRVYRRLRPQSPYDIPFLPFNMRAGLKFLSEYDVDFSRATLEGDLSKDFNPEETLKRVWCPVLLLWAHATRHETWGIIGALDENDLQCMKQLVGDLQVVEIPGAHEIHMAHPSRYIEEVNKFIDELEEENKTPV